MGEIVARFADGRLLIQEDRVMDTDYVSGGVKVRIGLAQTVEKVISIDPYFSGNPAVEKLRIDLNEVKLSGDSIIPIIRRGQLASGVPAGSGLQAMSILSGVTSGLLLNAQLTSGKLVSGRLSILANVIAI